MKRIAFLSLLALVSPSFAAPIDDAAALLQSKKYPEAAAALAALPPGAGEKGFAAYLQALSLHLADKQDEALAAADKVPVDSAWGVKAKFLKAYANQAREPEEEVQPSLKGALFLRNDVSLLELLKTAPGSLVGRLGELPAETIAEELYLSILTRLPTPDESATVAKVLAKHGEKKADAVGKLAWALLASAEFGVNH